MGLDLTLIVEGNHPASETYKIIDPVAQFKVVTRDYDMFRRISEKATPLPKGYVVAPMFVEEDSDHLSDDCYGNPLTYIGPTDLWTIMKDYITYDNVRKIYNFIDHVDEDCRIILYWC